VFTALVFCASFVIIHHRWRLNRGENWLALAYGLVATHDSLEIVQQLLVSVEPTNFLIFVTYLGAMTAMVTGLARRFTIGVSPILLASPIILGIIVYSVLLGLDRHDSVRPLLYQTPFVIVPLVGCWILWRAKRNWVDSLLLAAFTASAAIFGGKPFLADTLGIGWDSRSFLDSGYGAFSETFEAFFLVSTGVLLVIAVASDLLVEITIRSETDTLSGLFNRRGFGERSDRMIARAAYSRQPIVLVLADLDHFKNINDSFGHAIGDQVITAFSRVLRDGAQPSHEALVGRLGGEEFGVLLFGNVVEGRIYGESARAKFAGLQFDDIAPHDPFTASFGVAEFQRAEPISKVMGRADLALYEAKRDGRNRVQVAHALSLVRDTHSDALGLRMSSETAR
jgi:diguanylate cyclase (GGDEF)-like protein